MQRRFGDKTEATQSVSLGGNMGQSLEVVPRRFEAPSAVPQACGVVPVYMWGINVSTHCLTEEIQL